MAERKKIGWLFGFSFWAVVLLPLALCCGLLGIIFAFGSWDAYQQANRVEALQPISAAEVQASPTGQEILVEGRIGTENEPGFGQLVAYTVERRDDDDSGSETGSETDWDTERTEAPPLQVELPDGAVWLEPGYRLEAEPNEVTEGNIRYKGFQAGDSVLAVGVVVRSNSEAEKRLDAEFIYGGTQAQYVEEQRNLAALLPWCGSPFLLIAAILMLAGVLWVVLGARSFRTHRDNDTSVAPPANDKKVVQ